METTSPVIVMASSLVQKEIFKASIKDRINEGYLNPLELYRQIKIMEDCLQELKKDAEIFEAAKSERDLYGKEKPVINGSIVDLSSRTTYDYDSCNDSTYNRLKKELKDREAFLKTLPPQGTVDPESGEIILAPVKKISEFITVKI